LHCAAPHIDADVHSCAQKWSLPLPTQQYPPPEHVVSPLHPWYGAPSFGVQMLTSSGVVPVVAMPQAGPPMLASQSALVPQRHAVTVAEQAPYGMIACVVVSSSAVQQLSAAGQSARVVHRVAHRVVPPGVSEKHVSLVAQHAVPHICAAGHVRAQVPSAAHACPAEHEPHDEMHPVGSGPQTRAPQPERHPPSGGGHAPQSTEHVVHDSRASHRWLPQTAPPHEPQSDGQVEHDSEPTEHVPSPQDGPAGPFEQALAAAIAMIPPMIEFRMVSLR
jgi:hypothetical protein